MEPMNSRGTDKAIAFIMDRYKAHIDGEYDLNSKGKRELLEIEANFRICENNLDYENHPGLYGFRKTAAILLGI
jgi:hypothetical protein